MRGLTKRQAEILEFIISDLVELQRTPTIREIGSRIGITSTNGIRDHLNALARKGYLQTTELQTRSLRVLRWPDGAEFRLLAARGPEALPDTCGMAQGSES